jgi:pimeloyl-ACP methyl ester carboxylesterase
LPPPHLILLPGLGADRRFLARQLAAFPDAIIPPWIPPERNESLPHYAERLAAHISPQLSRPCVIAGVSLGGMVALEMARHLRIPGSSTPAARSIVLIGSCREPSPVHPFLRFSEFATRPVPAPLLSLSLFAAPLVLGRGFNLSPEDRRLLVKMVRETPLSFVKWGARAVLSWRGHNDPAIPIRSIHGARDWVIRPHIARPELIIPGGPHVLNFSHPKEVNDFLQSVLDSAEG